MNQSLSTTQTDLHVEGELSFDIGGALSKELKGDLKYRPFQIVLIAGTNSASVQSGKDLAPDKFVAGIDSHQGKSILEILDSEEPWKWQGLKAIPFANGLYLNGRIRGKTWTYISVYPSRNLERLLVRLRQTLQRR